MIELTFTAPAAILDAVSDRLTDELDALSVSVTDADAGTGDEHAKFGEPGMPIDALAWERSAVSALFTTTDSAQRAATQLLAMHGEGGLVIDGVAAVDDDGWVRKSQAQFESTAVTSDFWIVPTWREPPPEAARVIRLDPGLAFGTGTHPTTRMCLRWIATQPGETTSAWQRALDYGCGSGILAIGAALFGAKDIDAVDIDPAAVDATRANAHANGVSLRAGLPEQARGRYALVLANILATPLKLLAPVLCAHVGAGGHLVLAGILERQADDLQQAYAPFIALDVVDLEDGWITMAAMQR